MAKLGSIKVGIEDAGRVAKVIERLERQIGMYRLKLEEWSDAFNHVSPRVALQTQRMIVRDLIRASTMRTKAQRSEAIRNVLVCYGFDPDEFVGEG